MDRRKFLIGSLFSSLYASNGMLFAAPRNNSTKMLVIFLRGAYDSSNFLVPYSSDDYYDVRSTIAIPRPGSGENSALRLDDVWALHPAVKDSLLELWKRRQISFIPFTGTSDLSRSHFQTQDLIESGQPADGKRTYGSGFLNRLAFVLDKRSRPVSFTSNNPVIVQGQYNIPLIPLGTDSKSIYRDEQISILEALYKGTPQELAVREGASNKKMMIAEFEKEKEAASRNAITPKGFDLQVRRMALLMKEKYNLGFLDIGKWDTHVNQGGATGMLANLFSDLGSGLATFANEMGGQWENTIVYVMSEFGRTFRENGNGGTDHGHGTVHWLIGGGINGGKILGEQVPVNIESLNQNRDYPVLNDGRNVLATLFKQVYALDNSQLQKIFPGSKISQISMI